MLRLALRGVRFNLGRYIATLVAIITGVAFFAATGFLGDRVIDALQGDADRQFGSVEAAVVVDDVSDAAADFGGELRIDGSDADAIAALPEVAAIGGDLSGSVSFLADDGGTFADGAIGRLWIEDDDLNPIDIDEGAAPAADGEIAIDTRTADSEDLAIGDQVTILTLAGQFPAEIVGITSFGNTDAQDDGGTVSISGANAFDWLNSGQVEYEDLFLRGTVDEVELQAAVEPLVPAGYKVQTGDDFLKDKRGEVGAFGQTLKTVLQGFATLALFVGAFVIYNTFSVIVAQRLRELAVLAAIGATPKQLKRSLRYEGLAIGLLGSVLGVIAGFGLTFVMIAVLELFGVSLPGRGISISPTTVIQGILAGTIITFLSVMIPARRAARTEPIEALRQAAVESATLTTKRIVTALALVGLGAVGMLFSGSALSIAASAVVLFVGVIVAGPLIAVFGAKVFRPMLRWFGLEGRLAADNTARNPQRTATTSNALLIGVFLVTLVTVAGTSVKDFAVDEINALSSADFIITSDGGTIDDGLVASLEEVDGVEFVTAFRREVVAIDRVDATPDGESGEDASDGFVIPSAVSTGDLDAMVEAASIEVIDGTLDDLGPGKVLTLDDGDPRPIGSTVTFTSSQGATIDLEVVGTIGSSLDTTFTGSLIDSDTFDEFVGETAPTVAFLDAASGSQSDVADSIDDITSLRPDISVQQGNALGQIVGTIFDFLINAVNGLLLMSVAVALIGIVNTLSLSILERRRELGLLRVIGMVDKRVQRMVRIESVLISALGTVSGLVLGVFTGAALILAIDRLTSADIALNFAPLQLLLILVLGVGLGFVAALIPAKRSTRLDVLDAINAT